MMNEASAQSKDNAVKPFEDRRLARLAAYTAIGVALFLLVIKGIAGALTGSVSLLGSLIDSLLDAAASLLNALAIREASQPADLEHRFGHGKAEAIAGLGQAALITGSAGFLIFESVNRLLIPLPLKNSTIGLGVIGISIAATLALVIFQRYVIKRTGSLAISADSLHYRSDLIMNGSVVIGIAVGGFLNMPRIDAAVGLLVGFYIGYGAWTIVRLAYDQLMDREFDDTDRERIKAIVEAHKQVRHMHDLRTRRSGYDSFIQLHVELDPQITLAQAHAIADQVEAEIKAAFPSSEVIIHQDPAGLEDLSSLLEH